MIFPPLWPPPGPSSIIHWEDSIIPLSCSTTMTVFPSSASWFIIWAILSVSLAWSPTVGSSRTYNVPVNNEASWLERFILWYSPPESVLLYRSRDRYLMLAWILRISKFARLERLFSVLYPRPDLFSKVKMLTGAIITCVLIRWKTCLVLFPKGL